MTLTWKGGWGGRPEGALSEGPRSSPSSHGWGASQEVGVASAACSSREAGGGEESLHLHSRGRLLSRGCPGVVRSTDLGGTWV